MKKLFINAAFRDDSRTKKLADAYIEKSGGEYTELDLGTMDISFLNRELLKKYNRSVETADYSDKMFDLARQFSEADEIVIAAPFWNYSIPAALHAYLELVCTQGVTFDMAADGTYFSKCRAVKLTYITTAGGYIPEEDHAFGYVKALADFFFRIPEVNYYSAEGLDIQGINVEEKLNSTISTFKD